MADNTRLLLEGSPARFWAKVDQSNGPNSCWLWTGCFTDKGYGTIIIKRKNLLAHRVSYALENGIEPFYGPDQIHIYPICGHRSCVNPSHLRPIKKADSRARRNVRLNENDIRAIRRRAYDKEGIWMCMDEFGVSEAVVLNVYRRKSWKHVSDDSGMDDKDGNDVESW